jgi:hypothetical protein
MNYKKGAMFGLDARIALAIFGALSVISGAALYSAIQDSRVTAVIADLNEMGKAYEAYLLDTGVDLKKFDGANLPVSHLITNVNNVSGWNGPYISYETNANTIDYKVTSEGVISIFLSRFKKSDFSGSDICSDLSDCMVYVTLRERVGRRTLTSLYNSLEEKIDGDVNYNKGRVRRIDTASYVYVYYQYMPAISLD